MKLFFRLQIIGGFLVVLAGLGGMTYLASRSNQAFLDNSREIIQYNQILYHSEQVRSLSADLETSQRGYTITKDSAFLKPYQDALPVVDRNVDELAKLLSILPLASDPIPRLKLLIKRKNDSTGRAIRSRNESFEAARLLVASYSGNNIMDSIRRTTSEIEAQVNALLTEKRAALESEIRNVKGQVILIIIFTIALLVTLFWLIDFNFAKRMTAETVLQQTVKEKENLYQKSPCGYFSLHPPGLEFMRVNDTFLKFTGYSRQDLEGISALALLTDDSRSLLEQALHGSTGLEPMTIDLDFVTRNNHIFSGTASVQRIAGENPEIRGSVIDCREKRIADARILQLNRELEEFSYSVSHDLRGPLRLINGYAHILKEDHPELLNSDSASIVNVIITNAKKMGHLIDDLLSFARLSRAEVQKEPTDFRAMVESAFLELTAMQSYQAVDVKIGDMEPVPSDVILMKQVWLNLISNAIKYSSGTPKPRIEIGSFSQDSRVCFFVKDNGVGFNMSYSDKLFKVFQRLHRDDEFPGTGVGLALVKKIITRQGGSVWAEGTPGEGATFYFSLPNSFDY